jgi:hypothetical protein
MYGAPFAEEGEGNQPGLLVVVRQGPVVRQHQRGLPLRVIAPPRRHAPGRSHRQAPLDLRSGGEDCMPQIKGAHVAK